MAHENENEQRDSEDEYAAPSERRRPPAPRFGPFVTIAVAILLLFGAASRFGKTSENAGWLNLDFLASRSLERETARRQEQRNATLITLGAVPAPVDFDAARGGALNAPARELHLAENVIPPARQVDFSSYAASGSSVDSPYDAPGGRYDSPASLSLAVPTETNRHPGASETSPRFDPAPEAKPQDAPEERRGGSYTVLQGDNWVKIGKHAGKRWQDIQKANPQAQGGLRVGMKLVIP